MSALDRLAAVHSGEANAAAWDAFLADVPMSWIEVRRTGEQA